MQQFLHCVNIIPSSISKGFLWWGKAETHTNTIQQLVIRFFVPTRGSLGEAGGICLLSNLILRLSFLLTSLQYFVFWQGGTQQTAQLIKNSTVPDYLLSSLPSRNGSSGHFLKNWIYLTRGVGIRAMQIRLSSEITAVNNPQRHYLSKGKKQAAPLNIQSAAVIYVSFTMIDGKG